MKSCRPSLVLALWPLAVLWAMAAVPAAAALYKWTDERGVVNYSNEPPPDTRAAKNVRVVEAKLSVYTPDAALLRSVEAVRERAAQRLAGKPDVAEREPLPEHQVLRLGGDEGANAQAAYDNCIAVGRTDCNDVYGAGYYPYASGVVLLPLRQRPPHAARNRPPARMAGSAGTRGVPGAGRGLPMR